MIKNWYLDFKPGHYILPQHMKNPDVDRRMTSDWRSVEAFIEGTRFYARAANDTDINNYCKIEKRGSRFYSYLSPRNKSYSVLVNALVPVSEDYEGWKHRVDLNSEAMEYLIDKLVATNLAPASMLEAMLKIRRKGDV